MPKEKGKSPEEQKDQKNPSRPPVKKCYRYRKLPAHSWEECPAIEATCLKCKKHGHFAPVCKCKVICSVEEELQDVNLSGSKDRYFVGAVHGGKSQTEWTTNLTPRKGNGIPKYLNVQYVTAVLLLYCVLTLFCW